MATSLRQLRIREPSAWRIVDKFLAIRRAYKVAPAVRLDAAQWILERLYPLKNIELVGQQNFFQVIFNPVNPSDPRVAKIQEIVNSKASDELRALPPVETEGRKKMTQSVSDAEEDNIEGELKDLETQLSNQQYVLENPPKRPARVKPPWMRKKCQSA